MDDLSYLESLRRARGKLPKQALTKAGRWRVPPVENFVEGNRTFITNWRKITRTLNRDPLHIAKFLAGELATSANDDGGRLVLSGKFSPDVIDRQLNSYSRNFVICPECEKPDTKLVREERLLWKICEACGARSTPR